MNILSLTLSYFSELKSVQRNACLVIQCFSLVLVSRDGQNTLRNILLQDTVIGKLKYLITIYCYSQYRVPYYKILDTLEKTI